jgi:hypothetical protein
MTWTPKGWWTPSASAADHMHIDLCHCSRCAADGQHNLLCEVHQDPPKPCDCARSEMPKAAPPAGAS